MSWWDRLLGHKHGEEQEVQQAIEERDRLFGELDQAIKDVDVVQAKVRRRVLKLEAEVRSRHRLNL